MESLKLTYFNSKGRAEAIRLALTVGDIKFEDERIGREEFLKRRTMLPLHSLPALEVDKETFCETDAILRYVGSLSHLYPKNKSIQCLKIDQFLAAMAEFMDRMSTAVKKDERACATFVNKTAPRLLESLNNLIAGPLLLGDKLTIADLQLYTLVSRVKSGVFEGIPESLMTDSMNYTNISSVYHAVRINSKVRAWEAEHEEE